MSRKLLVLTLMLALLVSTVGIASAAEEDRYGGTLVFGRGADAVRLDPADVTDGESVKVITNVFEGLVRFKAGSTEVEPGLATGWRVSDDGKVWEFKLQEGVKFHDGTDLTADDVVFSFERQMDEDHPYHEGDFAYWSYMYSFVNDVEKVNDYQVKITLDKPYAPFIYNLACFPAFIVSEEAMKDMGVEDFRNNPVGTGPFEFVEWEHDSQITLEAFEDYWDGRPYLDKVVFRVVPENTTRVMGLKGEDLDLIDNFGPQNVSTIKEADNLKLLSQPGMNVSYMAMNQLKEPLDNKKVRQAINWAVDKESIIEGAYSDSAESAKNPLPPTLWGYNDRVDDYGYDPEKAKELLAEAGYEDGFEIDLWYPNNPRPYMPEGKKVAQAIQSNLKEVGIDVELVTHDWGTYLDKLENGEHDMSLIGWIGDNGDPDNFIYVLLDKSNTEVGYAGNYAFYRSDLLHDILVQAQETTAGKQQRAGMYKAAQHVIHEDAPWVPIAHMYKYMGAANDVMDFKIHPTGQVFLRNTWLD
ncbi:MAG: ABC transporter substrate-binding protein [Bacillota bacterium]